MSEESTHVDRAGLGAGGPESEQAQEGVTRRSVDPLPGEPDAGVGESGVVIPGGPLDTGPSGPADATPGA